MRPDAGMNADSRGRATSQPGWGECSEIEHMQFKIHSGLSVHSDTLEHAGFSRSCGFLYPQSGKSGGDDI